MAGTFAPVITGLVAGIGLIGLLIITPFETTMARYPPPESRSPDDSYVPLVVDPTTEFHFTRSGLIVLDTHRIEDNDFNRQVIDILLRNYTIVKLLEGEYMVIFGIGTELPCSFGSCAMVRLDSYDDRTKVIHLFVDYANNKVASYY